METKADFEFNKDGFFHQMFGSYGAAVCGLALYEPTLFKPIMDIRESSREDMVVNFRSIILGKNILLKPITTYAHLHGEVITLPTIRHNLLYMLINICYENVKDYLDKNKPVHEFFRHLRNSASHGGNYFFKAGQPNNKAEWRGIEITNSHNSQPIWSIGIDEGDVFLLLYDVEQDLITSTGKVLEPSKILLT